jgi:hypothetical protein
MSEFLSKLLSSDLMPHGFCYLWKPEIVWLHAVSDGLIALAYYSIPVLLVRFARRRPDLPFHAKERVNMARNLHENRVEKNV